MTKRKLKPWVKQFLVGVVILIFISIVNHFDKEMEEHIEKVSIECASQGYGITVKYAEGEKYYVCKK